MNLMLTLLAAGLLAAAEPTSLLVQVEGRAVHLTAPRWKATLEEGLVVAVENRLSGEVYARCAPGAMPRVPAGLGVQTGAVVEAKQLHTLWGTLDLKQGVTNPATDFPSQHRPHEGSRLTVARPDPHTVTMTYHGLAAGARQYPEETFTLTARLEEATGDLVLSAAGKAAGGVYGAAVGVVNLDRSLKATLSHMGGLTLDADWPQGQYSLGDSGPFLEGPVIALESRAGGALAIWAQDATFRPKNLFWQNTPAGFNVVWQTRNIMPFEPLQEAESVQWHLNCFRGSWVAALEPYRNWFQKAFAADIATRPAWASRVRVIFTHMPLSEDQMQAVVRHFDPSTVLLHAWAARRPDFDTQLPDFTPREDFVKNVALAHRFGLRTSAYVNAVCINNDPRVVEAYNLHETALLRGELFGSARPRWSDLKPGQLLYTDPLSARWRALHARLMKEFVEKTGVDSLYEDCAGTCGDYANGVVDGLRPLQGTYHLMRQTRQAVPAHVAFSSEYHVERTAPFVTWALHGTAWGGKDFLAKRVRRGRPVNNYIWGPHVLAWVHVSSVDLADVLGGIEPISAAWLEATRGEPGLALWRAKLFAQRQLRPAFPTTPWEPDVLAYYEDGDGRLYRLVERSGHVMLGPDNQELYRRTRGLTRVASTLAIPGWPAYDASGPIGLDPTWEYCLIPGRRGDTRVVVHGLGDGVSITGYREGEGYALLTLAPVADRQPGPSVALEYGLTEPATGTFVNGVPQRPRAVGRAWRLDVEPEATIVFLSGRPGRPAADGLVGGLHDQGKIIPQQGPALELEMTRGKLLETGVQPPGQPAQPGYLAATPAGVRLVFDYVVEVPEADSVLRLYGYHWPSRYGDGQRALIWINGRLAADHVLPRDEAKYHQWDIPLGAHVGRPVLLTIASDPRADGNSDNMRLTRPRIVRDPAVQAPTHRVLP